MVRFRSDFELNSDLVFETQDHVVELAIGDATITFRNAPLDENNAPGGLIVTVVGDADGIDVAGEALRECLRRYLDLLSFTTQSGFSVENIVRTLDWEPGLVERKLRSFHKVGMNYPPAPELGPDVLYSAGVLDGSEQPAFVRTALKYFRYGLLETDTEDQFMRFWLSLEISAENTKSRDAVPISCPRCEGELNCKTCGAKPTRVPMAKQAIESLIAGIVGEEWRAVAKRQFKARNGLMHGRSAESIEQEIKMPLARLVDELGLLSWEAIRRAMPNDSGKLVFIDRGGGFTNRHVQVVVHAEFEHRGPGDHPDISVIPKLEMSLKLPPNPAPQSDSFDGPHRDN